MVIVLAGCCNADGCDKQPSFGFIGEKPRFCATHKLGGMTDVKNKRCEEPGCGKTPNFAEEGQKPRFCSAHKLPDHVNVKGPFCYVESCRRRRALSRFCVDHLDSACSCKCEESNQLKTVKMELDRLRTKIKQSENRVQELEQELNLKMKVVPTREVSVEKSDQNLNQIEQDLSNNGKQLTSQYNNRFEFPNSSFIGITNHTFPSNLSTMMQEEAYPLEQSVHKLNNTKFYPTPEGQHRTLGSRFQVAFPPHSFQNRHLIGSSNIELNPPNLDKRPFLNQPNAPYFSTTSDPTFDQPFHLKMNMLTKQLQYQSYENSRFSPQGASQGAWSLKNNREGRSDA